MQAWCPRSVVTVDALAEIHLRAVLRTPDRRSRPAQGVPSGWGAGQDALRKSKALPPPGFSGAARGGAAHCIHDAPRALSRVPALSGNLPGCQSQAARCTAYSLGAFGCLSWALAWPATGIAAASLLAWEPQGARIDLRVRCGGTAGQPAGLDGGCGRNRRAV